MSFSFQRPLNLRNLVAQLLAVLLLLGIVLFLWRGGSDLAYNWQWYRIPRMLPGLRGGEWMIGPLAEGLQLTFFLALAAVPLTCALGLAATMAGRSRLFTLNWLSRGYVELVRNTPMLVQLYLLYFMLANFLKLEPVTAGLLALTVFEGAFAAEIFRAGFDAVPKGQVEAARSLGLSRWQSMHRIIMPQSLPLILPALANLFVSLVKHSSIVSVVAIPELTDVARNIIADTYLTFEVWLVVAAIYFTICYFLSLGISVWERRLLARVSRRGQTTDKRQ